MHSVVPSEAVSMCVDYGIRKRALMHDMSRGVQRIQISLLIPRISFLVSMLHKVSKPGVERVFDCQLIQSEL